MPEGHTLHRLARLHTEYFAGGPVRVSSPQGRFAAEAALRTGCSLLEAEADERHLVLRGLVRRDGAEALGWAAVTDEVMGRFGGP